MNTTPISQQETVELSPKYNLSIAIVLLGIALGFWQLWLGIVVGVFGLFLVVQTAIIRLKFTPTSLEVYRSQKLIREFPYSDWLNWRIFWTQVPILFYFREVKSIHFLPMLFDSKTLQECLEKHCS